MLLYRVCRTQFANDLSGTGSRIYGGRWNSPGIAAVYTSESKSLAVLESLTNTPPGILINYFSILTIEISGKFFIDEIPEESLPGNWNEFPAPGILARLGDKWLKEGQNLLLKIPSAIITSESNFIINPVLIDLKKVKIISTQKLELDKRIITQLL
jgi:RES domain-containing protein